MCDKLKFVFMEYGLDPEKLPPLGAEIATPEFYNGIFNDVAVNFGDYRKTLKVLVSRMLSIEPPPPLVLRLKACYEMTEAYINQTDEAPDGVQLGLLANWILADDLRNTHPDKVTNTEYPILNKRQLRTRHRREKAFEGVEQRTEEQQNKKKNTTEHDYY